MADTFEEAARWICNFLLHEDGSGGERRAILSEELQKRFVQRADALAMADQLECDETRAIATAESIDPVQRKAFAAARRVKEQFKPDDGQTIFDLYAISAAEQASKAAVENCRAAEEFRLVADAEPKLEQT